MENKTSFESVKNLIQTVQEKLKDDSKLGKMFENCYANTLDTTVKRMEDGTSFVITGDIPAMWLRDSVCQLRPYLILCKEDPAVADLIEGLIKRQVRYILTDPYANAFNEEANGHGFQEDKTQMQPIIWERKYEIDSLCFPMQFSYLFWKNSGRTSHFNEEWKNAAKTIIELFRVEQNHEKNSTYSFERTDCTYTDTLSRDGKGALVKGDIGLVWSGFRPSDDACVYGYLIPSNMLLVVVMDYICEIAEQIYKDSELAEMAKSLGTQVRAAIEKYAVLPNREKDFYAYEVDGFGQYLVMDDANLPSLLAMPYVGYCDSQNERYRNTRSVILSEENPFYYAGKELKGIGSPHTPPRYIWHIGLAMQGLTSDSKEEKYEMLKMLRDSDGGTNLMHEGVFVDDAAQFTRPWFSWANAMFSELVLDYLGYGVKK